MSNPLQPETEIIPQESDPAEASSVYELLKSLGVKPTAWDYLIVTDGSGSQRPKPGGYAALVVTRSPATLSLVGGAASSSTSQEAEVRAAFEGLNLVADRLVSGHAARVHLLTDSKYVATQLAESDPLRVYNFRSHGGFWAGIQHFRRNGLCLTVHHLHRNTNPLLEMADRLSKVQRLGMVAVKAEVPWAEALSELRRTFPMSSTTADD